MFRVEGLEFTGFRAEALEFIGFRVYRVLG